MSGYTKTQCGVKSNTVACEWALEHNTITRYIKDDTKGVNNYINKTKKYN